MTDHRKDYYEILGIEKSASQADVKAAYRKLAMKYHPDRNPGNKESEEKFKEAAQAYEILSDEAKRKQYDQFGHSDNSAFGHGSQDVNMDDIFSNFGDIFESMFGGGGGFNKKSRRAGPVPQKGHDRHKEIEITLKEAFTGSKKEISYYRLEQCETCKGQGTAPGTKVETCKECQGVGQIQYRQGFFVYSQTCNKCGGHGYVIPKPCHNCSGQTRKQKFDKFSVTIPEGIFEGAELRVPEKGDAGIYGGPSGDLYLKIKIIPDKRFKRVGDNIECTVMLTYPQLVFGCQIEIENIDGTKEAIKIPKGCPSGERITVAGKGFTILKSKKKGNLVIITQCHIPTKLSNETKETLKKFSEQITNEPEEAPGTIKGFFKKFLGCFTSAYFFLFN